MLFRSSCFGDELFPRNEYGEVLYAVSVRSIKALIAGPYNIESLHPAGTRIWSKWFFRKINEYAISSFLSLYRLGFTTVVLIVFALICVISFIQWIVSKFRKKHRFW